MTSTEIKQYTDSLELTCSTQDCEDILAEAIELGITDVKDAVWTFLDAYEGISHSCDHEYWSERAASQGDNHV